MSTVRPLVTVYNAEDAKRHGTCLIPGVFSTPLRPDLIRFVFTNLAKNTRQAYGVTPTAGYDCSAKSWGTGRAVARIPRHSGGGTYCSGQAAFGNMCRGGGMFAPNKTWRRWHRKVNVTQKRYAVASALAATAIPALVMARGHRIDHVPELPLVISDKISELKKTRNAVNFLKVFGCSEELEKVIASKKIRAGSGKARNRRYTGRRGPLIIYQRDGASAGAPIFTRAFRNIPGIDLCSVEALSLSKLAPGGSLGRFCIWTKGAFEQLSLLFGKSGGLSTAALKKGYHLPRPMLENADIARIINSEQIQAVVRPVCRPNKRTKMHKNLLTNHAVRCRVNPAHKGLKAYRLKMALEASKKPRAAKKAIKKDKTIKTNSKKFIAEVRKAFSDTAAVNMAQ